jgi:hypothetical protein
VGGWTWHMESQEFGSLVQNSSFSLIGPFEIQMI